MTTINNEKVLRELLSKQLKNIELDKKLQFGDIKRIAKYLKDSIFGDKCSIWNGYITNLNKDNKGTYINFYYKEKKVALHRLLYINYIGELEDNEYLKFSCPNKGKCCNINHFSKHEYSEKKQKKKENSDKNSENKEKNNNKKHKKGCIDSSFCPEDNDYILDFE